jgi:hypothetical protein
MQDKHSDDSRREKDRPFDVLLAYPLDKREKVDYIET